MSAKHELVFEDVHDEKSKQCGLCIPELDCSSAVSLCRCMHMNSIKSIKTKKAIMQQVTELIRFVS